jgi:hypothetical protein
MWHFDVVISHNSGLERKVVYQKLKNSGTYVKDQPVVTQICLLLPR